MNFARSPINTNKLPASAAANSESAFFLYHGMREGLFRYLGFLMRSQPRLQLAGFLPRSHLKRAREFSHAIGFGAQQRQFDDLFLGKMPLYVIVCGVGIHSVVAGLKSRGESQGGFFSFIKQIAVLEI